MRLALKNLLYDFETVMLTFIGIAPFASLEDVYVDGVLILSSEHGETR
jgi:hypothetical protein